MAHTVVGVFDTSNEAQTALRQLVSSGISRDNIDIAPQTASETADDDDDDSISGFFRSLFGGDDKPDRYARYARKTGAIVTVHAKSPQEADQAADILDEYGAVNLDERISGTTETDTNRRDTTSTDRRDTASTDKTIPIIEEELHAGKRTVDTGGVRVRSRIIDRPVEEHLRLREEHVHVERNRVNRPATEADMQNFKEGEMEITEHAEVPVVNKGTRVVEEISLGKEVEEHDEAIRDTVRHTEVDIDKLDPNDPRRTTDPNDPRRHNDPNDPNRNRNL